ncbi:MAG: 2-oxoacid:acceptor oxidoreductase family protein [Candidatus Omnitrophica bacterium]|nr:2-oxoacid:acceptor oxidoreductase family protein [Candidatus Omnitrophota bacterium]
MREEIICAGFGGQGIMLLGKVIAQAAMKENKHLTWIPSYGSAMRGGTAFCTVVISKEEIASPYVDKCDSLFVFNQPSWDKFKRRVRPGGLVLLNSTLIKNSLGPKGVKIRKIPFTDLAASLGNARVANMIALGVYLKEKNIVKKKSCFEVFAEIVPPGKEHLVGINKQALDKGYAV